MGLLVDDKLEGVKLAEETDSKASIKYEGNSDHDKHVAIQATEAWILEGDKTYYYEVAVKSTDDAVGVGLAPKGFPSTKAMPGWLPNSYAYHGDDGNRFLHGGGKGGWPTFAEGAVVGVGLKASTGEIFGTLNGKLLGLITSAKDKEALLPTIGFNAPSEVDVFFDKKDHKFDISSLPEQLTLFFGTLEEADTDSSKLIVLYTNGADEAQKKSLQDQLQSASNAAQTQYGFYSRHTDKTDGKAASIREFTGILERSPLLVVIDGDKDAKYAISEGEAITSERILQLLAEIKDGKATSLKKSAARPPNDQHPACATLTQVVGSSFDELVVGGAKDVLLDVYADWCGPCRNVAPTLEVLSEVFADNDNIVIAQIDCDANDIDRTYLPETSIPNIKLFRGADKKNPIKYAGNRSLENFIDFLHANATVKFDLQAAQAKAKERKSTSDKRALKNVISIHTTEEFKSKLTTDKLVIVDYTAVWCGPCKAIAPIYAKLSEEYTNVLFLKVDVDELQEVAREQSIECMPTFKVYKKGAEVAKLEGANAAGIKAMITDNL